MNATNIIKTRNQRSTTINQQNTTTTLTGLTHWHSLATTTPPQPSIITPSKQWRHTKTLRPALRLNELEEGLGYS